MKETVSLAIPSTPILFPYAPEQFWQSMRQLIREEVNNAGSQSRAPGSVEPPGFIQKPLYKTAEVCTLFHITKPTVYDWIKHGKLKPIKIQSRVYFLWQDIQLLLHSEKP